MPSKVINFLFVLLILSGCEQTENAHAADPEAIPKAASTASDVNISSIEQAGEELQTDERPSVEMLESELGLKVLTEAWFGDLDGMIERRVIRVLTVYGIGRYYFDDAREQGFAVESMKGFEDELNKSRKSYEKVHIVFIPVSREQLIPGLVAGRGDLIVAGLTITPERQQLVDFSLPISKPIKEILVSGPSAPEVESLDDLAGKTIPVRESSSYYESLQTLNERFVAEGKPAMVLQLMSELLEDEDLLEMVARGLLPWVVVDDYKADIFESIFDQLTIHRDLVFREGGRIAYAFRKDSPQLAETLNAQVKLTRAGTLMGNILLNRYVRDYKWVDNALDDEDYGRFENVVEIFKKYGNQYGMDYLLVAAQGYQESRLDQSARSKAGAVGIMQLLPSTAADSNVGIPDISTAEANIHAGVKYVNFLRTRYFSDPDINTINQTLLAMAAYNAGPSRVIGLRKKAAEQGLDPNKWFGNVEVIAAKEVGREPVQYVANIYKYYVTYSMSAAQMTARNQERKKQGID